MAFLVSFSRGGSAIAGDTPASTVEVVASLIFNKSLPQRCGKCESRVGEFSAWFGNRPAEFARGFDPLVDDDFGVSDSFRIGLSVRHAAGQFRHFDNETVVFLAPINDQFVTRRHSMSILYFKSSSRTCFT